MRKILIIILLFISFNSFSQKDTTISKKYLDSLKTELVINKYKLERVRYRVKICKKNPKLKVFFFGWVDRITK